MHLSSALVVVALLGGQALAALNCTVAAPTLSKRLCESNSCPVYQTVARGDNLHAACRADCSTDDEPWIKLYDGTYVLATKEAVSGCRNFCQPYSVLGLPRCKDSHSSCHPSALKPRSASPIPLGQEPAPVSAIAAKCGIPLAPAVPAVGLARRSRALAGRYSNSTLYTRGVNGTLYARGINGTLYARGVNGTHADSIPAGIFPPNLSTRAPVLNSTTIGTRRVEARNTTAVGGWSSVMKRAPGGALNSTLAARAPYVNSTTANAPGHAGMAAAALKARSLSDPAFRNGSWSGSGTVGRRSPRVLKKLRLWA